MKSCKTFAFSLVALALPALLGASETQFWQTGTFEDFLGGKLTAVSLSKEGELRLAPQAEVVFDPEQTLALSIAAGPDRAIYIGTGHQGKVFRVDAQGHGSQIFQAPEPEILALAVGPDGAVYAASSPEGKIYKITRDGKSSVFCDPTAKYIWALAFDRSGDLYAGTGDRGLILRIDSAGKSQVFFDSQQTHIMCLAFERDGALLAGSEPNGLVYRLNAPAAPGAPAKAFVLYQSNLPEIHSLAVDNQGRIYAAALGGAGGKGTPQFFQPPGAPGTTPVTPTTITAVASSGDMQTPAPGQPPNQPPGQPSQPKSPSFNHPAAVGAPFALAPIEQGRGALIRILPDSSAETLWSSDQESIFGLALRGPDVLFSTDGTGRIFSLAPTSEGADLPSLTLLTETRESLATRLLLDGPDLYVATSNIAKLFRVGTGASSEGSYESIVKDTKFISHWGVLAWRSSAPAGSSLQFYTRSGNSERPDSTWSDWAGPYTQSEASPIKSPPARYIQWKAEFRGSNGVSPSLDDVTLSYLNENLPPEIRYLNVSTAGARTGPNGMVSPSPSAGPGISGGVPNPFGVPETSNDVMTKLPTVISWQADDPNGDSLRYALYLKSEREREWHLVKGNLKETNFQLDTNSLADGQYEARLVVSDEASNPPATARRAELVSAPFWIDNSPPRLRVVSQKLDGDTAEIHFEARTTASPLRRAEMATDTGEWRDIQSDDGIVDSRFETFTVKVTKLTPGEHLVSLRAYDTAGNIGVETAVVRVP